ncbi:MAG TPA: ATP-dependent helicase, partial [Kofleriaceae bacterium]
GRAGETGVAISFVTAEQHAHFALIEKRNEHSVPRERIEGFEPTQEPVAPPSTGGIKGARTSKKDKLRAAGLRPPKPT